MKGARRAQWHREREDERRRRRAALKPAISDSLPETLEVAKIRLAVPHEEFPVTQEGFARRFGFTTAAVRDWEQKRFKPEGVARVLLTLIAHDPVATEALIHAALAPHAEDPRSVE